LKRAFLTPLNAHVDEFNEKILQQLPGALESYYSADISIKEQNHTILNEDARMEFLGLVNHNGVPPHHLKLKVGAVCTLMRNMSVKNGLVKNVARLIIEQLHR